MPDVTTILKLSPVGGPLAAVPGQAVPPEVRDFHDVFQSLDEVKPVAQVEPGRDATDDPEAADAAEDASESEEAPDNLQAESPEAAGTEKPQTTEPELAAKSDPTLIEKPVFEAQASAPSASEQVNSIGAAAMPLQPPAQSGHETRVSVPAPDMWRAMSAPASPTVSGQLVSRHQAMTSVPEAQAGQTESHALASKLPQPADPSPMPARHLDALQRTTPATPESTQTSSEARLMGRDVPPDAPAKSRQPAPTETALWAASPTISKPSGEALPIAPSPLGYSAPETVPVALQQSLSMPARSHGYAPIPSVAPPARAPNAQTATPPDGDSAMPSATPQVETQAVRPQVDSHSVGQQVENQVARPQVEHQAVKPQVENRAAMTTPTPFAPTSGQISVETPAAGAAPEFVSEPALSGISGTDMKIDQADRPASVQATRVPEPAREIARQLAPSISAAADGQIDIGLSPKELGNVRMTLSISESGLTLTVNAERWETADLMRRYASELSEAFKDLGYDSIAFSFGGGSDPGTSGEAPEGAADANETTAADSSQESAAASRPTASARPAGGLDLRI